MNEIYDYIIIKKIKNEFEEGLNRYGSYSRTFKVCIVHC